MNIYLDTNVLLDMFLDRDNGTSKKLFKELIENKENIYINDISIINTHYIISKYSTKESAIKAVKYLQANSLLISVDNYIIEKAILSCFSDFEDAVQYYCAKQIDANMIITQNIKDFINSDIIVKNSKEYLENSCD